MQNSNHNQSIEPATMASVSTPDLGIDPRECLTQNAVIHAPS